MPTRSRTRPSPNVDHILAALRAHLPELREQYGIRNLWVFGSYVRAEAKKRSDLDVLVEFRDGSTLSLFGFVRLERRLSELIGINVDLVEKSGLKPAIGRRILEEVVPV